MYEELEQRADAQNTSTEKKKTPGGSITALLYDVLKRARYSSYADLNEDLKQRCVQEGIPYSNEQIDAAITKVEQGGKRPIVKPKLPIDESDTVRRLSALSEDAALDYFWQLAREDAPRVPLLLLLSQVVISRPTSWDRRDVRRQHTEGPRTVAINKRECFVCGKHGEHVHHLVQIQHGGSNTARNQVALCAGCHQEIHPWLRPVRTSEFTSVADMARALLEKRHANVDEG